jgi:hypothetical protein
MNGHEELSRFAELFSYCAVCWSRVSLAIHHLQQGAGRVHDRRNLLRLCNGCHEGLHFGGMRNLSKGHCLTAKREVDDEHYDPAYLAQLRHKVRLGYGTLPYPDWVALARWKNGQPEELIKMAINSRTKGKVGELEAAAELNDLCPKANARRSQQHSGTESASDLIAPGLPSLWLEVKRAQRLNLDAVMEKSVEQCGGLRPVLLSRRNRGEWLITFRLKDAAEVCSQILEAM